MQKEVEDFIEIGTCSFFVGLGQILTPNAAMLSGLYAQLQNDEKWGTTIDGLRYVEVSNSEIYRRTGLTPEMVETAKRLLKDAGILIETRAGFPSKKMCHVSKKAIIEVINNGYTKCDRRKKGQRIQQPYFTVRAKQAKNNTFTQQPYFTVREWLPATVIYGSCKNIEKQDIYTATVNYGYRQRNITLWGLAGQKHPKNRNFESLHLNSLLLYNYCFFYSAYMRICESNENLKKIQISKPFKKFVDYTLERSVTQTVDQKKNNAPQPGCFSNVEAKNPTPPISAAPPPPLSTDGEHRPTHKDPTPTGPFVPQEATTPEQAIMSLQNAVNLSMKFINDNPDQLTNWISLAKWRGDRNSIEGTLMAFFGHYQGKQNMFGDAHKNPLVFLYRNFLNWLKNERPAQEAKPAYQQNGYGNHNQPQQKPTDPYRGWKVYGS